MQTLCECRAGAGAGSIDNEIPRLHVAALTALAVV